MAFPRYLKNKYARPLPSHRHAAPSAPWPWINLHDGKPLCLRVLAPHPHFKAEIDPTILSSGAPPIPDLCNHENCGGCWRGYPQSRFPNWTDSQVRRSGIYKAIHNYRKELTCTILLVDVDNKGLFRDSGEIGVTDEQKDIDDFWEKLTKGGRPDNLRVRALFVENMTGPVLQMLGANYNIEPFFFSSSIKWIPSRFQEEVQEKRGDHITITLTFLRTEPGVAEDEESISTRQTLLLDSGEDDIFYQEEQIIDTQRPLYLAAEDGANCSLLIDLLSVHLIRNSEGNTIISYHHIDEDATKARYLHERIRFAGQSVYWQSIFQKSPDPTFLLLVFIWHAMYAWDEALETLYNHICWMESEVMASSKNMHLTRSLHVIRAHHLHYSSLLEDFHKSVEFIWKTPNPAMDDPSIPENVKIYSRKLLEKECNNLKIEIERLEAMRSMQDKRLKNVMNLVFSTVNIGDSKKMQELTEAAVRDSAAVCIDFFVMKQIAYLSMIFLPASFVAAVFGMNVKEIADGGQGTLPIYFETALPLTAVTIWIVMAFQSKHLFRDARNENGKYNFWMRLAWPVILFRSVFGLGQNKTPKEAEPTEKSIRDDPLSPGFGDFENGMREGPRLNREVRVDIQPR
ncbi:hypothetical protein D9758_011150 [Tetrapyrgos nigripes]|uniref:Uncharacterized protein n=1 Tax=Tetrapyrgos nigripes TaxID=182062 RepID=A0A8H5FN88_9AGAR|nr:hypothetical protein D9758_011150 [Tetrapyrgos nigripes]